jgi:hypothetical protein
MPPVTFHLSPIGRRRRAHDAFHKVIGRMPFTGRTLLAFLASLRFHQRQRPFYPELCQPLGTLGGLGPRRLSPQGLAPSRPRAK